MLVASPKTAFNVWQDFSTPRVVDSIKVWSPLTVVLLRPSGDSPPPSVYRHLPTPSSSVPHAQTLPSTSTRSRGDAGSTTSPPKRRYVPDAADVEVAKKIRQSEVELRDHNTVLRVIKNNVMPYVLIHGTTHADVLIELFFLSQCVCCQAQA